MLALGAGLLAPSASAATHPTEKLNRHHGINLECDVHSLFLVAAPPTFCEGGLPNSRDFVVAGLLTEPPRSTVGLPNEQFALKTKIVRLLKLGRPSVSRQWLGQETGHNAR